MWARACEHEPMSKNDLFGIFFGWENIFLEYFHAMLK
jgi:hypothetical protein